MEYSRKEELSNLQQARQVMQYISNILEQRVYRIGHQDINSAIFIQSRSPTKNRIVMGGVSKVDMTVNDNEFVIEAELKGFKLLFGILTVMTVVMAAVSIITSFFVKGFNLWVAAAPFSPWPLLMPLMYYWSKTGSAKELNTMVDNAVIKVNSGTKLEQNENGN